MDDELQRTAYHEAGHAFASAYGGGRVLRVTIAPDWDDGPQRFGDTQVAWSRSHYTPKELSEKLVVVALAGPVTETIYLSEPLHPALVVEWSQDWRQAWDEAAGIVPDKRQRTRWLEGRVVGLHGLLSQDLHWEAIAGVADHLLAHETLEEEDFAELIANSLGPFSID